MHTKYLLLLQVLLKLRTFCGSVFHIRIIIIVVYWCYYKVCLGSEIMIFIARVNNFSCFSDPLSIAVIPQ